MSETRVFSGSGLPFPRWMRGAGLLTGFFLLSDGLRRLLTGGGGLSDFVPYLLVGSACVYVAGYDKKVTLSEKGFVRQTLFWGKGRTDILPWSEMEEMILMPAGKGTGVLFPLKDRGWRAFFPEATEADLRAAAAEYRPELPVSTGTGSR
ncbi:hypothetical protein [Aminivibrio sp.]|nr:hypothetical protein [Aminivibrio sp.]MDD3514210.1 hypothetical protein [Synergistaceae bacterium]MEA4951775.1 hypothetical protein [Aminivibrio sp.]NCB15456.1 hypothetical protein [Synergistales bacterium]HPK06759.1 hypothetical protein [Aminivibrio sp.]